MHTLVDERAAAVKSEGAPPSGISVIFRRAVPLHPCIDQNRLTQQALFNPLLQSADVGFHPVLEDYAQLDASLSRGMDQFVRACCADLNRFFRQNVEPALGGSNSLGGVQA